MAASQPIRNIQPPALEAGGTGFRDDLLALIPYLRAFARTLTLHRADADDLCQEALAKAWQSRASYTADTNLKAWLFTILRNQFYSEFRRAWRRQPWDANLAERTLVTDGAQEAAVALSDVARAMHLLPDEQREALILIGAGGFTYEEGAKICGCAVGTIKSRVSRGRLTLEAMQAKIQRAKGPRPSSAEVTAGILETLSGARRP